MGRRGAEDYLRSGAHRWNLQHCSVHFLDYRGRNSYRNRTSVSLSSRFADIVGWQANFFMVWLCMFTVHNIGVMWALIVGMAAGSVEIANSFFPVIIVPQIYLAGFYRPTELMPAGLRWLQWICGLKYAYSTMLILEFGDDANHMGNLPEHSVAEFKKNVFVNNAINPEKPYDDLLFYMLTPLVLYGGLLLFGIVSLKLSAMRR